MDGGVFANNPSLLAIVEAQKAFGKDIKQLRVLSISTRHQKFTDICSRKTWGLKYWIGGQKRIIELFMQGQSQQVQNLVSLLHKGIDRREGDNFIYKSVDTELDETCLIELDETDKGKLQKLSEKAASAFQYEAGDINSKLCI